ncbi:hypothetical protein GOP47_0015112 [Adiantum capillus-veneris]|uniref:Uncharacterized protein n=1 Tax=Adiantum capillus-veneris TaxID=13818 RepID=A0A9D4UNB5_ADICA|nr:hypothetical protein GOP47_0015112 [Adiantum capillus-veneris]
MYTQGLLVSYINPCRHSTTQQNSGKIIFSSINSVTSSGHIILFLTNLGLNLVSLALHVAYIIHAFDVLTSKHTSYMHVAFSCMIINESKILITYMLCTVSH